jgi:hypothetical protein
MVRVPRTIFNNLISILKRRVPSEHLVGRKKQFRKYDCVASERLVPILEARNVPMERWKTMHFYFYPRNVPVEQIKALP